MVEIHKHTTLQVLQVYYNKIKFELEHNTVSEEAAVCNAKNRFIHAVIGIGHVHQMDGGMYEEQNLILILNHAVFV